MLKSRVQPRKRNLEACCPSKRPEGVFVNPFERGEIGPGLFQAACRMGLEGLVSKRRDRHQAGRSKHWVKVKNLTHPAFDRVKEAFARPAPRKSLLARCTPAACAAS
jgi:ATP-dependent DNA ligase